MGGGEYRRGHIKTLAGSVEPLAAAQKLGALGFAQRDVVEVGLQLLGADHWPDLGVRRQRVADLECRGARDQLVDEGVVYGFMDDQP